MDRRFRVIWFMLQQLGFFRFVSEKLGFDVVVIGVEEKRQGDEVGEVWKKVGGFFCGL